MRRWLHDRFDRRFNSARAPDHPRGENLSSDLPVEAPRRRERRLVEAALELYGLRGATTSLLQHSFVQVFRVLCPTRGEFVLRLYGEPRLGEEELRSDPRLRTGASLRTPEVIGQQLSWLLALRLDTDLLVPEPVATTDGLLLGSVSVEGTPWRRNCVLLRWVPGRSKKGDNLSAEDVFALGSSIAQMHEHAQGYALPVDPALPRWDWEWVFGDSAPLWSEGPSFYSQRDMAIFEDVSRYLRVALKGLGEDRGSFGMIHRDLTLDNIVFMDGDVGVVDFDLCGLGYYLHDLTVTQVALRTHHKDRFVSLRGALLDGYRSVRSLPASAMGYFEVFRAAHNVAVVNRQLELLRSEATYHQAREARFMSDVMADIERLLSRGSGPDAHIG